MLEFRCGWVGVVYVLQAEEIPHMIKGTVMTIKYYNS